MRPRSNRSLVLVVLGGLLAAGLTAGPAGAATGLPLAEGGIEWWAFLLIVPAVAFIGFLGFALVKGIEVGKLGTSARPGQQSPAAAPPPETSSYVAAAAPAVSAPAAAPPPVEAHPVAPPPVEQAPVAAQPAPAPAAEAPPAAAAPPPAAPPPAPAAPPEPEAPPAAPAAPPPAPEVSVQPSPSLVFKDGALAGRRVDVTGQLVLGRENADLVIEDPEVSRRHATVRPVDEHLEISDLGSSNGTFVNGARIQGARVLEDGDEIRVGKVSLRVVVPPPPRSAATVVSS